MSFDTNAARSDGSVRTKRWRTSSSSLGQREDRIVRGGQATRGRRQDGTHPAREASAPSGRPRLKEDRKRTERARQGSGRPAAPFPESQKARKRGPFEQAAEGTRTLDLLHGKQTL